ncbi:HemK Methylase of polypeptide chain release factors [Rhabdaerophilaceae bacterium]
MTLSSKMLRGEALAVMAQAFARARIDEPRREARLLLAAALRCGIGEIIADPGLPLGAQAGEVTAWFARRLAHEPLSRIRGQRAFRGRDFHITPDVLDPRPETEELVDLVLARLAKHGSLARPLRLLDLGTGSGALIVTLLAELPQATGFAVDISAPALQIARKNAARHRVDARLSCLGGDLFEPVSGRFDAIVSNPPYIPSVDLPGLERAVADHDPELALDGGPDGLTFYRRISLEATGHLVPGGLLALEIGAGQAKSVRALLGAAGFSDIQVARDLAGHERLVSALAPDWAETKGTLASF